MFLKYPAYFNRFTCIADQCPDTCCTEWEVVVDDDAKERFDQIDTPFGQRIRNAIIVDEDGETIFRNVNGRCPFLNRYSLCDIQSQLGHDALCDTCALYPRYLNDYGSFQEYGLSFSCPEALRMILSETKPFMFILEDFPPHSEPFSPNMIKALEARDTAIHIFHERRFSIEERMILALTFGMRLQAIFWLDDSDAFDTLHRTFKDVNALQNILKEKNSKADFDHLTNVQLHVFDTLKYCEHQKKEFDELIQYVSWHLLGIDAPQYGRFLRSEVPNRCYFEHLAVYYLHRYFLYDAEAGEPLASIQQFCFSYFALRVLLYFRWTLHKDTMDSFDYINTIYRYSREIEHSPSNMDIIFKSVMQEEALMPSEMIEALSVF